MRKYRASTEVVVAAPKPEVAAAPNHRQSLGDTIEDQAADARGTDAGEHVDERCDR
jgi:hypothetical protein